MGYKLMTDSSADLPKDIIQRYDIDIVPLSVHFGDEEYTDLTSQEFYHKLSISEELPSTSQVPPGRFIDAFSKELDKGNTVICVTIGSKASGTFQSAVVAKEELNTENIILIDSNSLSLGTGYIVITIAKMLENNVPIDTIVEKAMELSSNKIEHIFCVDTLKYLKKGGRIKGAQAFIAEALNIKPILRVEDATAIPFSKVRGKKKVLHFFVKHIKETIDLENNDFITLGHAMDLETAKKLADAIREETGFEKDIILSDIGAIIGTHSGPGAVGVFYVKK